MIEYWAGYTRDEVRAAVTGHAGYAEKGHDIVCAGASMMIGALGAAALEAGELIEDRAEDGRELVRARRTGRTECYLKMFMDGMKALSNSYPDHVRAGRGETAGAQVVTCRQEVTG